jgi:hypothetical protein
MKQLLFLGLLILPLIGFSQRTEIVSPYYEKLIISVDSSHSYCIKSRRSFTSLIIKTNNRLNFDGSYLKAAGDSITLSPDLHNSTDLQKGTELIILPGSTDSVRFFSGKLKGTLTFHFLNSYSAQISNNTFRVMNEDICSEPAIISPDYWRKGLAEPVGTPVETEVDHLIIHHSAADPSGDYVNEIRNIYLLHTEVNKWDDIGYNFVIAPDGTIFQGRDNRDICQKDDVLGAHMCGKNSGTMGICLLGDFTDKLPAEKCLHSLYLLLAWKASKESMDIFGSSLHALGGYTTTAPESSLAHVAGHRDGCKPGHTVCPGNTLYPVLSNIRDSTFNFLQNCPVLAGIFDAPRQVTKIFPQPAIDRIFIQSEKKWNEAVLYDLTGKKVAIYTSQGSFLEEFELEANLTGIYMLEIYYADETSINNKVVIN